MGDEERSKFNEELGKLLIARTEQLRLALLQKQELLESVRQLQSLESIAQIKAALQSAIERFADHPMPVRTFGGEPGEPVPEVEPEDLKAVWQLRREIEAQYPGQQIAVSMDLTEQRCKPGADIKAVSYRTSLLWMISQFPPEQFSEVISEVIRDGQPTEAAFRAAAKVPTEWMGVGIVRKGLPFDMDEFLRLCNED